LADIAGFARSWGSEQTENGCQSRESAVVCKMESGAFLSLTSRISILNSLEAFDHLNLPGKAQFFGYQYISCCRGESLVR
jgi:hypothetical protein